LQGGRVWRHCRRHRSIDEAGCIYRNRHGGQPPVTNIASLLPGLWTSWIPETFAGVATYVGIACLGAVLAITSKDAQHHLRAL